MSVHSCANTQQITRSLQIFKYSQRDHAMTNINYVHDFLEKLRNTKPTEALEQQSHISNRVIELANQIKAWHDTRPVPERWHPVQLGRLAAQFNVSRELAAASLGHAGWIETRSGTHSFWQPE